MTHKKSLVIGGLATLALSAVVAACGNTTTTTTEPAGESNGGDDGFRIATVVKVDGISWFDSMRTGTDQFAEDNPDVETWLTGPQGAEDTAEMIRLIEDLIAQNVDAIVVVPNDPEAVAPTLKKARDAGIVVVTHEAPTLAETDSVDFDLEAFENAEFGQVMGEKLAEGMGGSGQWVAEVGSLASETHMAWYNAAKEYLAANYPDITPVSDQPYEDANDANKARSNAQEILNAYPDLKGFLGTSVSAGQSFAEVIKEKNITSITMSMLSLPSVAGPFLEEGWVYSAQTWYPAGAGYAANQIAYTLLKGEEVLDGADLGFEGYEAVTVDGKLVQGSAIMMLEAGQFPDGYPF